MQTSANDSHLDIAEPVSAIAADPVVEPMTNEASNAIAPVTAPATDKPRDSGADRSIGAPVEEPAAVDAPTNAGQALARARAAKGLTVEDVSRQLKLSVAQVHALESDNHASLPAPIFVRGFLRSYARFIGADISAFLPPRTAPVVDASATPPSVAGHGRMMRQQAGATVMEQQSYSRWLWAVGFIACVVGALAYYEFVLNVPAAAPTVVLGDAGKSAEQPAPFIESTPVTVPAAPPKVDVAGVPAAPAQVASASPRELHFVFKNDSWVEVIDGADATLHRQRNKAGTELKVKGTPPLQLVVGAASGVQLRYDGKAVDLSSRMEGDDIARFTLE